MVVITKICNKCGKAKESYEKFTFNGNSYDICSECAYPIRDAYQKINDFFIGVSANKDVPVDMTPEKIREWVSINDEGKITAEKTPVIGYDHELTKEYIHTEKWVEDILYKPSRGRASAINEFIRVNGIKDFLDYAYYTSPTELAKLIGCSRATLIKWYNMHGFKFIYVNGVYYQYDKPIEALN